MTELFPLLLIAGGFVALTGGATLFVDGASGLARRLRVSPLVIGLTVVALGTSAPEVAVNVAAAYSGQPGLAVGNVLGSNILNVLLVLGLCALVAPLSVVAQVVRIDVPVMVGVTLLFGLFAADGRVGPIEATLLVALLAVYVVGQVIGSRRSPEAVGESGVPPARPLPVGLLFVFGGATLLVLGSDWLVDGSTVVAKALGVDDRMIGLTVVAIGTSLPELAASLVATIKGERDLAVGNVVGSNIFNVLGVIGLTGLVAGGLDVSSEAMAVDYPVALGAAVVCLPILLSGFRVSRWEGIGLLGCYLGYLTYLVLSASGHPLAGPLAAVGPWAAGAFAVAAVAGLVHDRWRRR